MGGSLGYDIMFGVALVKMCRIYLIFKRYRGRNLVNFDNRPTLNLMCLDKKLIMAVMIIALVGLVLVMPTTVLNKDVTLALVSSEINVSNILH